MNKQMTFAATLEATSHFTQQLEDWMSFLAMDVRTPVVLAVHELLVNIVRHAYAGQTGEITTAIETTPKALRIRIRDFAPNGFVMPDQVAAPDLVDLPEGGMGLYIIQQAFDRVNYQHLTDGNLWQLDKTLGG